MGMLTPLFCLGLVLLPILGIGVGIGFLVRKRSKVVQAFAVILAIVIGLTTFVYVNAMGFGVYAFYAFEVGSICGPDISSVEICTEEYVDQEHANYQTRLPKMMLWSLVPEILRPSCGENSLEVCLLPSFGVIDFGGWGGTITGLTTLAAVLWAMKQKKPISPAPLSPDNS